LKKSSGGKELITGIVSLLRMDYAEAKKPIKKFFVKVFGQAFPQQANLRPSGGKKPPKG